MQEREKLSGLQAARFYAAMAIVFYHLVKLAKLPLPEHLEFIDPYFAMGVPLFYTLSAFALLVGYSGKLESRQQISAFFVRRFTRIAPLFYLMMLAYVLLPWPFSGGSHVVLSQFMTSLLFVFNLVPQHVQGFVRASWSIGVEMAFYAIFPLLALFITSMFRACCFLALSIAIAAFWRDAFREATAPLSQFGSFSLFSFLFYFAYGMVAYFVCKSRWARMLPGTAYIGISLALMTALITFASPVIHFYGRIFGYWCGDTLVHTTWGFALALFVLGIALSPVRALVNPFTYKMGDASFSLYLWHPVIIVALIRLGIYNKALEAFGDEIAGLLACAVVTLAPLFAISIISFRYIERPGMRLSRHLLPTAAAT